MERLLNNNIVPETRLPEYVDKDGKTHKLVVYALYGSNLSPEQLCQLQDVTAAFLLSLDDKTINERFNRRLPHTDVLGSKISEYFITHQPIEVIVYDNEQPIVYSPDENDNAFLTTPFIVPNGMLSIIGINKRPFYLPDNICEIALTIHQDSQGKGLGRRLLRQAILTAQENGYQYINANFSDDTNPSSKLFRSEASLVQVARTPDGTEKYFRIAGTTPNPAVEEALRSELIKYTISNSDVGDIQPTNIAYPPNGRGRFVRDLIAIFHP